MSTRYGIGREYDINCIPEAHMKTTTSQFRVVGRVPGTTTADWNVGIAGVTGTSGTPTTTARAALGINQSYLSTGSEVCSIRMFGLSKAICADSITAGDWVRAYDDVTTTGFGRVMAVDAGVSCTIATTSITSHTVILGRAMEDGSTNTVISVFVNPQLYDHNLIA